MPSNLPEVPAAIEIARRASLRPITEIAAELNIPADDLELYGKYKAKVSLDLFHRLAGAAGGKLILVTAITPTPAGEGKTTTSIGLADASGCKVTEHRIGDFLTREEIRDRTRKIALNRLRLRLSSQ